MGKASTRKRQRGRTAPRNGNQGRGRAPVAAVAQADPWGRFLAGDGFGLLALFLLVVAFYFPATQAGFVWDDIIVTGSEAVRSYFGLWQLWFETDTTYHLDNTIEGHFWPLTYTTF